MFHLCESFAQLLYRKYILLFYCTGLSEVMYVTLYGKIKALVHIFSSVITMCRQAEGCKCSWVQICTHLRQKYRTFIALVGWILETYDKDYIYSIAIDSQFFCQSCSRKTITTKTHAHTQTHTQNNQPTKNQPNKQKPNKKTTTKHQKLTFRNVA